MSTPNPLIPQGSLLEQQAKSKSTFQVAAFIVALHVVILGGLLFLGCGKEKTQTEPSAIDALIPPPAVTGDSNSLPADPFALPTNSVATTLDPGPGAAPYQTGLAPAPAPSQPIVPSLPMETVPTFSGSTSEYIVQKGDAASKIAKKQGVTLKQLQEANPGIDLAKLKISQKLQVPSRSASAEPSATLADPSSVAPTAASTLQATHTVKGGDNLSRIAKKYGVTVKEIRSANGFKSNDIKVGQKLKIPATSKATKGTSKAPPADASAVPAVTPAEPVQP